MGFSLHTEDAVARALRKSLKDIGRAYQKQSTELIRLCRLLAEISPGQLEQCESLFSLFDLAASALTCAAGAGKHESKLAVDAFRTVEETMCRYIEEYHWKQREILGDVHAFMEAARCTDAKFMNWRSKLMMRLGSNPGSTIASGNYVKIQFVLLKSLHKREDSLIVLQELDSKATVSEILWIFSRFKDKRRISLKQNPHFYSALSDSDATYDTKFRCDPLKDLHLNRISTLYVLVDRSSRIFLDIGKESRTFGNLWKPKNTVILKDIRGYLESADLVDEHISKSPVTFWRRSKLVESGNAEDWKDLLQQALSSDDADWLVCPETRSPTQPTAPWVPFSCTMKVTTDGASAGSTTTFVSTGSHINDKPKRPRSHKQRMGSSTITLASSGTKRSKPDGGDASASSIAFVETFNGAQLDLVTSTPRSPRIGSSVSARAHAEEAITRPSLFPHDSGTFLVDAELARRGFPSTDIRHSPVDSFEAAVSKRLHSSSPSSGNKPLNSRNFDLARHPTSTSLETSSTLPFFGGKAIVPSRSSADFDSTLPIVPAIGSSAVVFKSPVTGHDALGLLRTLPISFQERGPGQDVANDITSPLVAPTLGRGGSAKSSPSYMRIPGTDPNQGKSLDPAAAVSVRSDSSKFHDTPRTAPPPAHAPPSTPTVPLTPTHIPPPRVSSEPVISYNPIVQYGPGPSHLSSVSRDLPTPSPAHAMSPTKPIATQQSLARDLDTDSSRIIAPYAHSKIAPASHPLLPPSRTATPGSRPEPPPTVTAPSEKRGSWFRRHIVDPLKNVLGT